MTKILVLYYSKYGNCETMANLITRGAESVNGTEVICRTVPDLKAVNDPEHTPIPTKGYPYIKLEELTTIDGLCLGCPTYFGNMPAPMKAFWDNTTSLWLDGTLSGKVAGLFTSTGSLHGGQETTLISMMLPLIHHGMIITGIPYTEPALTTTTTGGTPYGASHLAGPNSNAKISDEEKQICLTLGKRVAHLAKQLKTN